MQRDEQQDLKTLADTFFERLSLIWLPWEYGAPGLDPRRPFGNSDVEGDVLELLGCEPEGDDGEAACWSSKQRAYASELFCEKLIPYLREQWARK